MNKREKTSMFRNEIGDAVSEIKRSFNQYATEMTACAQAIERRSESLLKTVRTALYRIGRIPDIDKETLQEIMEAIRQINGAIEELGKNSGDSK